MKKFYRMELFYLTPKFYAGFDENQNFFFLALALDIVAPGVPKFVWPVW